LANFNQRRSRGDLDEDAMQPVAFALKKLTTAEGKKICARMLKAVRCRKIFGRVDNHTRWLRSRPAQVALPSPISPTQLYVRP
jgi:hypothetical protein